MTEFVGKVEIRTDTSTGILGSDLILYDRDGKEKIEVGYYTEEAGGTSPGGVYGIRILNSDGEKVTIWNSTGIFDLGGGGKDGSISLRDKEGIASIIFLGSEASAVIGQAHRENEPGKPGHLFLLDNAGRPSTTLDGSSGDIIIFDTEHDHSFSLHGRVGSDTDNYAGIWLGAGGGDEGKKPGKMFLRDASGNDSMTLDGASGDIVIHDADNKHSFSLHGRVGSDTDNYAGIWLGAGGGDEGKKPGKMFLRDASGNNSIILDGRAGDIFLNNADCAEDFDVSETAKIEPGAVVVIEHEGKLHQSSEAYDKRVAGVISGAGDCKAGIVLDRKYSKVNRKPVALMGKVYCKVDAQYSPIEVGDLLTTSSTPGHAMKASDQFKAFGAVIGKALRPLRTGKGLIPILIGLQ
jgi:hypothetical protein